MGFYNWNLEIYNKLLHKLIMVAIHSSTDSVKLHNDVI